MVEKMSESFKPKSLPFPELLRRAGAETYRGISLRSEGFKRDNIPQSHWINIIFGIADQSSNPNRFKEILFENAVRRLPDDERPALIELFTTYSQASSSVFESISLMVPAPEPPDVNAITQEIVRSATKKIIDRGIILDYEEMPKEAVMQADLILREKYDIAIGMFGQIETETGRVRTELTLAAGPKVIQKENDAFVDKWSLEAQPILGKDREITVLSGTPPKELLDRIVSNLDRKNYSVIIEPVEEIRGTQTGVRLIVERKRPDEKPQINKQHRYVSSGDVLPIRSNTLRPPIYTDAVHEVEAAITDGTTKGTRELERIILNNDLVRYLGNLTDEEEVYRLLDLALAMKDAFSSPQFYRYLSVLKQNFESMKSGDQKWKHLQQNLPDSFN